MIPMNKLRPEAIERSRRLKEVRRFNVALLDPYRVEHLELTMKYAVRLAEHFPVIGPRELFALKYAGLAHDVMKVKVPDPPVQSKLVYGHTVELDLNRYVRLHLDDLKPFSLDIYFNTDVQLHALASGLFVHLELGTIDPRILYPIFFHSCPILPVYEKLDNITKLMVDIILLSDKLSSGKLKPEKCIIDLDGAVFGRDGNEFNFTAGVYLARLIGQGNSTEKFSKLMTEHYYQRWVQQNPVAGLIQQPVKVKKLKRSTKKQEERSNG